MKKALILHGTDNTSQDNWFPWLRTQLENSHWQVWVPDLPRSDTPNIFRYNQVLLGNKDWIFDEQTTIIGHSSGAVAILGLLQHLPEHTKVGTCILVGAFKDDLGWQTLKELFTQAWDFERIKTSASTFIFIHSDNDPYCPLEHAQYLNEQLAGQLIIKPGQGHFSTSTNPEYTQFPFLLELLEKT